jgi:hypothetical protein
MSAQMQELPGRSVSFPYGIPAATFKKIIEDCTGGLLQLFINNADKLII